MGVTGPEWANQYGKPDLERLGIFIEMPYMNGKGYVFPKITHDKGKNLLAGGPKVKTGKQDCYFDKDFKRIFTGEVLRGLRKLPPSKFANVSSKPFMPTGNMKVHSTPGDYYGTFSGKIEAFSNVRASKPKHKPELRGFLTGPGKLGGAGYPDICLNKYPEHSVEKYGVTLKLKDYGHVLNGPMRTTHYPKPYFDPDILKEYEKIKPGPVYVRPQEKLLKTLPPGIMVPTGPAKWQGGSHAGCFDKFPEHKPDKYVTQYDISKPKKRTGEFYPQSMALKTFYTTSVINENLRFKMNVNNQATYEPTFIKHLVGPNFVR